MKLTEAQIEELYAFTQKKYVEHYDVQTELVDHLASSIEEKMSESNSINFENALQQVYAQFGIFGFSELIEKKGIEATIKGRKLFRKSFFDFFKLPKILLFVMILMVSYKVFEISDNDFISYCFYTIIVFFNIKYITKSIRAKRSVKVPLLQLENIYVMSPSFVSSLFLIFCIFFNLSITDLSNYYHALIPLIFSLIIISYLAEIDVLDKLFNEQKRLYPEAFK
jgi:hypothetical protein